MSQSVWPSRRNQEPEAQGTAEAADEHAGRADATSADRQRDRPDGESEWGGRCDHQEDDVPGTDRIGVEAAGLVDWNEAQTIVLSAYRRFSPKLGKSGNKGGHGKNPDRHYRRRPRRNGRRNGSRPSRA